MPQVRSWDIFCRVVDNFGDAGVCWRLARQLAAERDDAVRLWSDDLAPLARMWPGIDPTKGEQRCAGVEVRCWRDRLPDVNPHDAVIEAFGCDVPEPFVAAMAARVPQPAWINLEYLSAEDWIESHHLLPSLHPRLPLTKHFFFPGFTSRSGGLLREAGLLEQRDALRRDPVAQRAFWRSVALEPPAAGELRISLFAYPGAPIATLLTAWAGGDRQIHCMLAEGVLPAEVANFYGSVPAIGRTIERGRLRLTIVPFLSQPDYDRLLWLCDLNFVRGEDSFVRAQWAARPMVWQIYPQQGNAHRVKLDAFLRRYGAASGHEAGTALAGLFRAWNGEGDVAAAWYAATSFLSRWEKGADEWCNALSGCPDLMRALAEAVENRL